MRRKRGFFWNIVLVVLVMFLAAELFLPRLASRQLAEILRRETEQIESLKIAVSSFPAPEILLGRLDFVEIKAAGVIVEGLYLDSLSVEYRDIILRGHSFTGDNTFLEILVKEERLNQYIQTKYPELKDFKLVLLPGQVLLGGVINFLEATINLQLTGRLFITEQAEVEFIPENLQVEDVQIPVNLIRKYVNQPGFSFDLKELAIPLRIDRIEVSTGELRIIGEKSR
ncbi:MAG: DUF2993 domain-containing protein [Halanaerobiales bacterium]|nr:DUF2993 domain-containing protein [Halanaerobiales bacterium]